MKKKIDSLGRLVIPEPYRYELGICLNDEIEIEKIGNKIIITNPKGMLSKEEIERKYYELGMIEDRSEYEDGFIAALEMVLNEKKG